MSKVAFIVGAALFFGGIVAMETGTPAAIGGGGFAMLIGGVVLSVELARW